MRCLKLKTRDQFTNNLANNVKENLAKLYETKERKEVLCVYKILCKANYISTDRLIELALTPEFENECIYCASADSVYRALHSLQQKGWVMGALKKGGYIWQLIQD